MPALQVVISDVADALVEIDSSRVPVRGFQAGIGPYGEPQLVRGIASVLNQRPTYQGCVFTKRTPDLLIRGSWALEFKIVRPFGDNGKEAENWSVNLLHPYAGNVSALGDCMKLNSLQVSEQKAAVVIGYEHNPPQIALRPLIDSFELIAAQILKISLGPRVEVRRADLVHSVHQCLTVFAWEVQGALAPNQRQ